MFTDNNPLDSARGRRDSSESSEKEGKRRGNCKPGAQHAAHRKRRWPDPSESGRPEEVKTPTTATCREDVTDRRTSREQGRRTPKRSRNRRRRPKKNDLAEPSTPKVVDSVICLITSKIYHVLGSIATEGNALKRHMIAVNTCSGYNFVRKADLPPEWTRFVVRDAPLPRLAGANSNPLKLTAVIQLAARLRNTMFRIPFVVADQFAMTVFLGTAFIDAHVGSIEIDAQRLELRQGSSVAIVDRRGSRLLQLGATVTSRVELPFAKKSRKRSVSHDG